MMLIERLINSPGGTEWSPETDPNVWSFLFNKGTTAIQWKKKGLFNKCVEQWNVHMKNLDIPPISYHTQKSIRNKSKTQL